MGKLRFSISMSLDGFIAGPHQSLKSPLGIGGVKLHAWAFELALWRGMHGLEGGAHNASTQVVEESLENVGAVLMGRNMFGGQPGPWGDGAWKGWWGESPPFHAPVFVVTHHPRPPLPMQGGTTFTFVTRTGPGGRGARGHAPQVPKGRVTSRVRDPSTISLAWHDRVRRDPGISGSHVSSRA